MSEQELLQLAAKRNKTSTIGSVLSVLVLITDIVMLSLVIRGKVKTDTQYMIQWHVILRHIFLLLLFFVDMPLKIVLGAILLTFNVVLMAMPKKVLDGNKGLLLGMPLTFDGLSIFFLFFNWFNPKLLRWKGVAVAPQPNVASA